MTTSILAHLNRIFADKLGTIPTGFPLSGESVFQFKRARELRYPAPSGVETVILPSGLAAVVPVYTMQPQLPDYAPDTWCIAKWLEPGYAPPELDGPFGEMGDPMRLSPDEWQKRFGDKMGYPSGGWWFAIQPLKPGYTPDEKWTRWAADHFDWQASMSLRDTFRMIMAHRERREEKYKNDIQTMLRQSFVNHVPGARGGSYLAFSQGKETQ